MMTLRQMIRNSWGRPFLARQRDRKVYHILGFGPAGKILGWVVGTTTVLELDPDSGDWWDATDFQR